MVPGKENRMRVSASAAGRYRGQCAEYCGGPHGWMAFFVVAHEPARYEEWAARQRAPAAAGQAPGRALFESHCAACHAIRGTAAAGVRGPDLTHYASRETLGAGRLPLNEGTTMAWIATNQKLKPGNLMPEFRHFSADELQALASYLAALR
jgi:cytochrome c oxidase subunit 2